MAKSSYGIILKRRTIRLFKQKQVPKAILKKAVNAARVAPSAANFQILEYLVVTKKDLCSKILPNTRWGGYVYPHRIPGQKQQPKAYILILINKSKLQGKEADLRDVGAAAENIQLTLLDSGVGSCWIKSMDREKIRKALKVPKKYDIDSLIAIGYPAESPKLENIDAVKYWLDKKGRLHVPKRPLNKIMHYERV